MNTTKPMVLIHQQHALFNVEFVHEHSIHKATISSINTSVRPNTDITTERAITSIREALNHRGRVGKGVGLDQLAFSIKHKRNNIEEVMIE